MSVLERVQREHREVKTWPLHRNDLRAGSDGYIHRCRKDDEPWPCVVQTLVEVVTAQKDEPSVSAEEWKGAYFALSDIANWQLATAREEIARLELELQRCVGKGHRVSKPITFLTRSGPIEVRLAERDALREALDRAEE